MVDEFDIRRLWFTGSGRPQTFDQVVSNSATDLIIGTDSHRSGRKGRVFATAVCLPKDDKGRRYFWTRHSLPKKKTPNIFSQILMETMQSIEVAEGIIANTALIPSDITIHIDCSPEGSKYKSSVAAKTVFNMVRSYGFDAVIKPSKRDSLEEVPWAASGIADKHAR